MTTICKNFRRNRKGEYTLEHWIRHPPQAWRRCCPGYESTTTLNAAVQCSIDNYLENGSSCMRVRSYQK